MGMAMKLRDAGRDDFVVLEKADDVGGTWRDNTYPGCECDIPSHMYSFSYELNPTGARAFSGQPEIWDYMRKVADEQGIRPYIHFGDEVTGAHVGRGPRALDRRTADGDDVRRAGARRRRRRAAHPELPEIDGRRHVRRAALPLRRSGTTPSTSPARRSR